MNRNSLEKQKYQALLMRCRDAETQKKEKELQLQKAEEKNGTIESAIRKFCESILAKDRSEMRLGGDYNWRSLDTLALIAKAVASNKHYNEERTDVMKRTLDLAEERRSRIEGLEDQIKRLLIENEKLREIAGEEPVSNSEEENHAGADPESGDDSSQSPEVYPEVQSEPSSLPVVQTQYIIDEGEEITRQAKELIGLNEQVKISSHSVPVYESQQKVQNRKKANKEILDAHMVDLNEYETRCTEVMWYILDAIGTKGISVSQSIEAYVNSQLKDVSSAKIRIGMITLINMMAMAESDANTPLYPRRRAFRLTHIGSKLYKSHFGSEAVTSELERVIAEHDNPEHGYGIMDVAEVLEKSGRYSEVSLWNRKNAIKLSEYSVYIPDIIAKAGNRVEYIKYERGTHTQADFNAKCNKMCQVTRFLHFVVPNTETLNGRIIPQIQAWIKEKGKDALINISIKISTARYLKDHNPGTRECWQVIFKSGNPEPVFSQ